MSRIRTLSFLFFVWITALSLVSCSGLKNVCTSNCGVSGNATVSVTMTDAPPTGASVLSFTVVITGASFTPVTGTAVALTLTPATPTIELTRLQSDSAFLGAVSVPAGTYNSAKVTFGSPDIVLVNQTGSSLTGATTSCPTNSVCEFKPKVSGAITVSGAPFPLTLATSEQRGISFDFNLNNVLTFANNAITVDFTQAGVLTASALPRAGTPSGSLDLIEDFTGEITTLSGNNVTVQSGTRGSLTAVASSNTTFNIDPTVCSAQNLTCLGTKKTVSIDAAVNPNGTLALLEADLLDNTSVDEVEGVVSSVNLTGSGTIDVILSDKTVVSGNSLLSAAPAGTAVAVAVGATPTFSVDTKGLSAIATSPTAIADFAGVSNVAAGQVVRMQVTNIASVSGSSALTASSNSVVLRFSRMSASDFTPPVGVFFSLDGSTLPAYLGGSGNPLVQISTGQTQIDGVTDFSQLAQGKSLSLRALFIPNYLTSPFFAAKVRVH